MLGLFAVACAGAIAGLLLRSGRVGGVLVTIALLLLAAYRVAVHATTRPGAKRAVATQHGGNEGRRDDQRNDEAEQFL